MSRYDARKSKVNALFKFHCDNNVLYKHLRDASESTQQEHSLLNATQETLSDMLIVHTIEDPQAAVDVAGDKDNIRRPKIFEEAENESEELEVHQDASLFTTKDSVHPESNVNPMQEQVIDISTSWKMSFFFFSGLFRKIVYSSVSLW